MRQAGHQYASVLSFYLFSFARQVADWNVMRTQSWFTGHFVLPLCITGN